MNWKLLQYWTQWCPGWGRQRQDRLVAADFLGHFASQIRAAGLGLQHNSHGYHKQATLLDVISRLDQPSTVF